MSEKNEWLFRIEDILHSIERIEKAICALTYDAYAQNEDVQDITDRRFQIIGEAARKVPEEIRQNHSQLPWSKMIGLRNFVVHEYKRVDRRVVWDTINKELPPLKTALKTLLSMERNEG